jgi:hypothetical protein
MGITMKKKPTIDPEIRALWRENRRRVEALLQRRLERDRELAELEERRRARLRRLTFGLLGRP